MERKQFLRTLGAGAAFAITFPCLGSCSKDSETEGNIVTPPTNIDFTIDLNSSEGQKLANNGDFILKDLVVVVKNLEGNFVAATQICSHEQYDQVRFVNKDGGIFYCDVHGSEFSQNGTPLNTIPNSTSKALKIYNTSLEGSLLRVFE
ncbi:Rieske 2Fe-2S domain-containing protein [Maribacter confluentis]|uniref:Ferredoxin subunit of nitrite reductase or a ring-hydroxylating dioxygenase n=2 Tax=Maribacter TaxID=252356 RepID=A0ABY1SF43_9FLAO|nr:MULTISPECIES: Rieske 2Fe-2S domain-containing protein [Maribacter]MDO1513953.1 Rieske 2Fe-2S domain-containing protein [Maribacter confluentis]SNR31583.1 Ferredoxin subunit of nitrite reductase or a ring-hydroxylating dioxygenase [Maribacter sedimenticola]